MKTYQCDFKSAADSQAEGAMLLNAPDARSAAWVVHGYALPHYSPWSIRVQELDKSLKPVGSAVTFQVTHGELTVIVDSSEPQPHGYVNQD